jgi:uncharacterized protein (DUF1501 family)
MSGALTSSAILNPILTTTDSTLSARFSGLTSNFAQQLLAIAKVIEARSSLGASRQVFLATLGSFDTHTNQLNEQQTLLAQLDAGTHGLSWRDGRHRCGTRASPHSRCRISHAISFPTRVAERTMRGAGHPLVIGGAVKGGSIYGTMPTLQLSGPDDASNLGRWIPTIAVDQFAATLATWFGADATMLATVLPNLSTFTPSALGFI